VSAQKPVSSKGSSAYYTYDGNGQRVRRKITTFEIWQVYGFGGELLAEYLQNEPSMAVAQPQLEYGYRNGQLLVTAEPWINAAWNQPATQANTLSGNSAAKAVDGDVEGDLGEGHTSATNANTNSWWQVDLQSVQQISSITVWGRTDCCSEMTSDFHVFVSDSPFNSTALSTTQAQSGVNDYPHSGFSGPSSIAGPTSINVNRTGRYVRVQLSGTGSLALGEVQVWSQAAKVEWLVTDQLGTPRLVFDKTGTLATTKRHDYLPFGEELTNQGLRAILPGYAALDGVRQKFTQKERDNETGLDYFGARYYGSTQGRFTSSDEFAGGPDQVGVFGSGDSEKQALPYADIANPQSLNKYQYTFNNPLRYTDSDGHDPQDPPRPGVIQQIVDKTNEIVGALLRNFERSRDQVPQEEERRRPLNLGDKQIQTYMDAKGRAAESAMDIMEYGDFTGVATTYRGVATGDRSKTVIGVIGMALNVVPALKPVSAALEKVGLKVLTNKAGVMTAEGTASQAGKLFNLLRGGNKVEFVKPGVYIAKSAFGKGYVTFRTAAASQSKKITVDFYYIQGALKKIHLTKP
jgi:RHS repeat-associated protein